MFDEMLAERRAGFRERSSWAAPISAMGHVVLIGLAVLASREVVKVVTPPTKVVFDLPPAAQGAPPPPGPAATSSGGGTPMRRPEPEPRELMPPLEPPVTAALPDVASDHMDTDADMDGSPLGGVPGDLSGLGGGGIGRGGPGGGNGEPGGGHGSDGTGGEGPFVITSQIQPPVLVHRVKPRYPEMPRRAKLQGKVILSAVISAAGAVEEVTVLSSNPYFDEAAIEAIREWRYEPARQGGRPVAVFFTIVVDFTLSP